MIAMETLNDIHIFKTNINKPDLAEIHRIFDRAGITRWTVDMEDCDLVLRVVSDQWSENEIGLLVSQHGFLCAPLP